MQRIQAEDCSNGVDDNGDGLVDCEDYTCYFQKPNTTCNCIPSNTIWTANGAGELLWANTKTGVEKKIGSMGTALTDLAWGSDGVLYGTAFNANIYEVNPVTAQISVKYSIPGYFGVNAMTSDQAGNFYLAGGQQVFRYNTTTRQVSPVADLTAVGAGSGGDLAFSNGALYLACNSNQIAKIDITNGSVQLLAIQGLPSGVDVFGIVSAADGSLYLSGATEIFKLDPTTMRAVSFYKYKTTSIIIWGLANYNDNCNAPEPDCKAEVEIAVQTAEPYCSGTGVALTATGKGITGSGRYQWTFPDGTGATTAAVNVSQSGWYKVVFSAPNPFCMAEDSVYLNILNTPYAHLGADTVLCAGSQITIQNQAADASWQYVWQDGSNTPQFTVRQQGKYWLTVTNACGTASDTILVNERSGPLVGLGASRQLCPYDTLHLYNTLHLPAYEYQWSNGLTTPAIVANQPGWYGVVVRNECGAVQDSVLIQEQKEGCECFLYVPNAFTPNGDGKNDILKVLASCDITGELTIFNRWGGVVFNTKDLSKGWNGSFRGKEQPGAVYVYMIRYRFRSRPVQYTQSGTLMLVR